MKKQKPLRTALKDMLNQEQLSEAEIRKLMPKQKTSIWIRIQGLRQRWTFAAMSTVMAGLLIVNLALLNQPNPSNETYERIATEVMTNHLYMKLLDVETESMQVLQGQMATLGFVPQFSSKFDQQSVVLLGGRFCTLQGAVATQLHFKTETGAIMTQYQTLYDARLFGALPDIKKGEKPKILTQRGIEIQLWQESGLLMASAKPTA